MTAAVDLTFSDMHLERAALIFGAVIISNPCQRVIAYMQKSTFHVQNLWFVCVYLVQA